MQKPAVQQLPHARLSQVKSPHLQPPDESDVVSIIDIVAPSTRMARVLCSLADSHAVVVVSDVQ